MKHIVFFKLYASTEENQDALIRILNKMQGKLSMVDHMETGKDFLHSDRSFDVVLEVTLPESELTNYANDPLHCLCKEEFAPLVEKTVTVDVR